MNIAHGTIDRPQFCQRKHHRSEVKIMAKTRVSGGLCNKVRIVDLSQAGFQMECLAFLPADRPVFLTMPGLVQLECGIAWRSDWHYGCTFTSPLYAAVYDHIIKAHRQLAI